MQAMLAAVIVLALAAFNAYVAWKAHQDGKTDEDMNKFALYGNAAAAALAVVALIFLVSRSKGSSMSSAYGQMGPQTPDVMQGMP